MRLFIGIKPPAAALSELEAASAAGRAILPRWRWTRPGNWHLTLAFLGERPASEAAAIRAAMGSAAAGSQPFDLTFVPWGAFPNPDRARVLWLGLGGPGEEALVHLQGKLAASLGIDEGRPYHPHLTMARARGAARVPREVLERLTVPGAGFPAAALTLYRSHLSSAGSVYESLAAVPLSGL